MHCSPCYLRTSHKDCLLTHSLNTLPRNVLKKWAVCTPFLPYLHAHSSAVFLPYLFAGFPHVFSLPLPPSFILVRSSSFALKTFCFNHLLFSTLSFTSSYASFNFFSLYLNPSPSSTLSLASSETTFTCVAPPATRDAAVAHSLRQVNRILHHRLRREDANRNKYTHMRKCPLLVCFSVRRCA